MPSLTLCPGGVGQVGDQAPFPRVVAFRDNTETTDVEASRPGMPEGPKGPSI